MGFLYYGLFYYLSHPLSLLLLVIALVHYFRRRPDAYWLWIILLLGPIGALIYVAVEVVPDLGLLRGSMKVFPRRKRIRELEMLVRQNPAPGNWEELGDLYMEEGRFSQARAAYDHAIAARSDTLDAFYRRGVCAVQLGDAAAAIPDLEKTYEKDPSYDFYRAGGLLAHAYAMTGQKERAEGLFRVVTERSVSSETYLNFADLLASEGKNAEARAWAQKVLDKRAAMPGYQRRRERPWFRSASKLLRRVPA
ncbi:MAG TPA: tetratricopeptide repeat protein [Acidobacteriaceae bacterium]|nr:tetratricopeptide repeat protein [Acidobacteriaceae bacterium]